MTDLYLPPLDWPLFNFRDGVLYSNLTRLLNETLKARLEVEDLLAEHAAWEFHGVVWFNDGRWHEVITRYHVHMATMSDPDLDNLITVVNDRFGYA